MLLKISIPTFNRIYELDHCLGSIEKSIKAYKHCLNEDICIYVYDNNIRYMEELNTIKSKYMNILPNLNWIKNSDNLGSDVNIAKAYLRESNCNFIHVLADDDFMLLNYFNTIIPLLKVYKESDVGAIYLNAIGINNYNDFYERIFKSCKVFKKYSYTDYINLLNIKSTFVSSLIINCNNATYDPFDNINSNFVQLGVLLQVLKFNKFGIYTDQFLVGALKGNSFVTDKSGAVLLDGKPIENDLIKIYVESFYNILNKYDFKVTKHFKEVHFNKFILWEFYRRRYFFKRRSIDFSLLNNYFSEVFSFKILKSTKSTILKHYISFLLSLFYRLIHGEFRRFYLFGINKLIFFFKNLFKIS